MKLTDAFVLLLPLQLLSQQEEGVGRGEEEGEDFFLLLITTFDAVLLLCSVAASVVTAMSLSR